MNDLLHHLSLIDGIGPAVINHIIEKGRASENFSPDSLYAMTAADIQHHFTINPRAALLIAQGLADRRMLAQEKELCMHNHISSVTILDAHYPPLLRTIYLPPPILYFKGALPSAEQLTLAVVGSRKADEYGKAAIDHLLIPLLHAGWCTVSGGALGIDSLAHHVTVQQKKPTYAVLGSGLLSVYPVQNKKLFEKIVAEGGGIVSAFSARAEPLPGNFPARNRIISGLSRGCLVVQAAAQSGAKITAHYALEQGRELFVVPGRITDELSVGCHELLRTGAHLVMNATDIASVFGCAEMLPSPPSKEEETTEIKKTKKSLSASPPSPSAIPITILPPPADAPLTEKIVFLCATPCLFDDLVTHTNTTVVAVQEALFELQLQGKITQHISGLWATVK